MSDATRALRSGFLALGALGWGVYVARLLRRSLHMLQLEGYLSGRFLRWWLRRSTRITPPRQAAGSAAGLGLAILARGLRGWPGAMAALGWSALGGWLARSTAFPPGKKPLVMTARARRLVGGEVALGVVGALVLGMRAGAPDPTPSPSPRRGGEQTPLLAPGRGWGWGPLFLPRLALALTLTSLSAPLATVAANLLLFPVEAALRRYYLRDAAAKLRRHGPTVVAVAGSYGKTSTKEFLAAILSAKYDVLKPPGSHNTPMGLARVIREQLEPRHEVFVAELGDWVRGDIAFLCRLLRPKVGILTTIGPEHLERFKTMDNVVASKRELLEALPADGTAVINQDDPTVRELGGRAATANVARYGLTEPGAHVRARDVRTTRRGLELVVEADDHGEAHFEVGVLGRHNVANLLAATAAALALGMTLEEVARAARRIQPVEHRLQPIEGVGGVLVIDDAFNSNPVGAAAALEVLAELDGGQRILVTPGMVELAELEAEANCAFGRQAAKVCDQVILVGRERAAPLVAGLREAGFPDERLHVVADLAEATARLGALVRASDVVLFENDLPDTYADAP